MINIDKSNNIVYYIISDDEQTVFHFGKVEIGQTLISGLYSLETFQSKEPFEDKLRELGLYNEYIINTYG